MRRRFRDSPPKSSKPFVADERYTSARNRPRARLRHGLWSAAAAASPAYASHAGTLTATVIDAPVDGTFVLLEVGGVAAGQMRSRDAGIGNWVCESGRGWRCRTAYRESTGELVRTDEVPTG